MIRSLASGDEREVTPSPAFDSTDSGSPLDWFPDGRSLLVLDRQNGRILYRRIDVRTGAHQVFFKIEGTDRLGSRPALSADGKRLFYSVTEPMPAITGAEQLETGIPVRAPTARVVRRNVETGESADLYRTPAGSMVDGYALSPDGAWLAFTTKTYDTPATSARGSAALMVVPSEGGAPRELARTKPAQIDPTTSPNEQYFAVAWTRDSQHLLVSQTVPKLGTKQLWAYALDGGDPTPTGVTMESLGNASIHPDGRRLAIIGRTTRQELWVIEHLLPAKK
jgi:Tol biopolymer transport system component